MKKSVFYSLLVVLLLMFTVFTSHVSAQISTLSESDIPPVGITFQKGDGHPTWTYPYSVKLSVWGNVHRNFELVNTGKGRTSTLAFRTYWDNGTSATWTDWRTFVYQNSQGRVGIGGIIDPEQALSVKGYIRSSFDLDETEFLEAGHGGNNAFLNWSGDGNLDFRLDSEGLMTLQRNGELVAGKKITAKYDGTDRIELGHGGANAYVNWTGSGNLDFRRGGTNYMTLTQGGALGLGVVTPPSGYKLAVKGKIIAEGLKIADHGTTEWSDFVFEPTYELMPLSQVEQYILANKYLPDVPSAKEVAENGIDVASMDATLLQKIEELTLYTIEQEKQLKLAKQNQEAQQKLIEQQQALLEQLVKEVAELKKK